MRAFSATLIFIAASILLSAAWLFAADADANFHNAPASAKAMKNPYEGRDAAVQTGKGLYAHNCASCHAPETNRCV
jgi:mono/diheme cytochrome c family protein